MTLPSIGIGLFYYTLSQGASGFVFSLSGTLLGIGLLIVPYLMGGMGAGDAKLLGSVGAILGPKGVFIAFLFTAIAGGIYAVILLGMNRKYIGTLFSSQGFKIYVGELFLGQAFKIRTSPSDGQVLSAGGAIDDSKPRLCYGLAIAVGTLSYLITQWAGYPLISW